MKRVLIISHDASLTGAPKLLLNLMSVLQESGISINTLLKHSSGSLFEEFRKYSRVFGYYYRKDPSNLAGRIKRKIFKTTSLNNISPFLSDVDFVLNNTITNGDLLPSIRKKYSGPVLTYVHELEVAAKTYTNQRNIDNTIACTDLFLVPCLSVKSFLVNKLNIPENKICILNYFIVPTDTAKENFSFNRNNSKHPFVAGGCGTQDWRKGADIFIQVAKRVLSMLPEDTISFRWKGANIDTTDHLRLMYELEKLGISNNVEFIPSSTQTNNFYKEIDLFLLPSREDPYPLVVLEAASFSVPSIAFEQAGGACEFIAEDAGSTVGYLSVDEMADRIIWYYHNRKELLEKGKCALQKLKQMHQDPQLIFKQLQDAYIKSRMLPGESIGSKSSFGQPTP